MADALLRLRSGAMTKGLAPLAIVTAPHISDATAKWLGQYAETFGGGSAFGFVDHRGRFELHGPGLKEVRPGELRVRAAPKPRVSDLFSDKGQWLIKVLLARSLPGELLTAPREDFRNALTLAAASKVSVPSTYRVLEQLELQGFLDKAGGWLRLIRVEELLHRWSSAVSSKPSADIAVRWLLPPQSPRQHAALLTGISRQLQLGGTGRVVLALFSAAEALGARFVQGAPLYLYVDDAAHSVLEKLGLGLCEPGQATDVFLRVPRSPTSVFGGAVTTQAGAVSTDVLQTWLDVAHHPARGREQAERIWSRFLRPALGRG
ncbi:MAG: hypothetical protein M3Y59_03090 [Myxococcota bacterium]|nr:hypothetical protein [Myxococcota bacterium]